MSLTFFLWQQGTQAGWRRKDLFRLFFAVGPANLRAGWG